MSERIVAVGLLTARDLEVLGSGFRRLFPLDAGTGFDDLLAAIDDAVERDGGDGANAVRRPARDRPTPASPGSRPG